MKERCAECLFGKGRIVCAERAKELIAKVARQDTDFLCHKGTIEGTTVVCRGSFEMRPGQLTRISERLGMLQEVTVEEIPGLPKDPPVDDEDEIYDDEDDFPMFEDED